jgi:hypothetical protein
MMSDTFIPEPQITANPRRKRNRFLIAVAIVIVCVFVAIQFFSPESFEDVNVSMGTRITASSSSGQTDESERGLRYYDSIEEAISEGSDAVPENTGVEFPEVFRFESDDSITSFYFRDKKGRGTNLIAFTVEKSEEQISEPIFYLAMRRPTDLLPEWPPFGYIDFTVESCAAHAITNSIQSQDFLSNSNNGEETLVGYTTDPAIKNLTILGQPPTDIIEFEYRDETWYVWYYVGLGAIEHLISDPDFSFSGFTYRQVVEILEIKV